MDEMRSHPMRPESQSDYSKDTEYSEFDKRLEAILEAHRCSADVDLGPLPVALANREELLRTRLTELIVVDKSDLNAKKIRAIADRLALEQVKSPKFASIIDVLDKLCMIFGASTNFTGPEKVDWSEALAIAGYIDVKSGDIRRNTRRDNLRCALMRMGARKHVFLLKGPGVDPSSPGFRTATAEIFECLARLGRINALHQLVSSMRAVHEYEFDVVLFGRNSNPLPRSASYPFGFLWQLTVKIPDTPVAPGDPPSDWAAALKIAQDLVTLVDVETYGQFWMLGTDVEGLSPLLGNAVLHDHLFSLQQWSPHLTPLFVESFFTTENDHLLRKKLGWGIKDAVLAARLFVELMRHSPCVFSRSQLHQYLPADVAGALMSDLVHRGPAPNSEYASPFDAYKADLMFRPLIEGNEPNTYIIPCSATVGPAFYEAVMTALRRVLSPKQMDKLPGAGLERATAHLLRLRGIRPTAVGLTYRQGADAGECDVVIEDGETIVFFECKAKAITRTAMSGDRSDALLAYLEGVTAAQAQSLQHETILKRDGKITFENGTVIHWNDRQIVRVSMTLHDHGTLQDRSLFAQLSSVISSIELGTTDLGFQKRIAKLNQVVERFRKNLMTDLNDGVEPNERLWRRALPTALLSYSHLATFLVEHSSPTQLAEILCKPVTFTTGSVLKEFHLMRTHGLLGSPPSG